MEHRATFLQSFVDNFIVTQWYDAKSVVFCGDFNVVEDPEIDRSSNSPDRQIGLAELFLLKDTFGVVDCFRYKHPRQVIYSFFSHPHGTQSRLDRLYCSANMADHLTSYTVRTVAHTDHSLILNRFRLSFISVSYGPSFFKMNTLMLSDVVVKEYILGKLAAFQQT